VHKKLFVACVLLWDGEHAVEERKMRFGTFRRDLERQKQFKLKRVNARHFHGVDGKQTVLADAAWPAELLQCGLLKASFVPPREIRELRDLTRLRVSLLQDQNRVENRIEKILEDANIKLGSVASDIFGNQRHADPQGDRQRR